MSVFWWEGKRGDADDLDALGTREAAYVFIIGVDDLGPFGAGDRYDLAIELDLRPWGARALLLVARSDAP